MTKEKEIENEFERERNKVLDKIDFSLYFSAEREDFKKSNGLTHDILKGIFLAGQNSQKEKDCKIINDNWGHLDSVRGNEELTQKIKGEK